MQIRAFRHLWGLEGEPLEQLMPRLAEKGYVGVEAAIQEVSDPDAMRRAAAVHGLTLKPLLVLEGASPEAQIVEYAELLELALSFDPEGATVHSGRDAWPLEESIDFYREAVRVESAFGLEVGHETHRGRPLFSPWDSSAILEAVAQLRLVCDFSHWVVVAERLLEDQEEAIELAATRAVHVHARVGFDQGPQVRDPRLPEAAAALAAHERWWERVWEAQRAAGATATSFAPEYGPAPYLPSGQPTVDLEEVCDWQATRVREQFGAWQDQCA